MRYIIADLGLALAITMGSAAFAAQPPCSPNNQTSGTGSACDAPYASNGSAITSSQNGTIPNQSGAPATQNR